MRISGQLFPSRGTNTSLAPSNIQLQWMEGSGSCRGRTQTRPFLFFSLLEL